MEPLRLEVMRRGGELIAYWPDGAHEYYYPLWQFDEEWRPLPIVPALVREARERGLTGNRLYEILAARSGLSAGGGRLGESLRKGKHEHVLDAVRLAQTS